MLQMIHLPSHQRITRIYRGRSHLMQYNFKLQLKCYFTFHVVLPFPPTICTVSRLFVSRRQHIWLAVCIISYHISMYRTYIYYKIMICFACFPLIFFFFSYSIICIMLVVNVHICIATNTHKMIIIIVYCVNVSSNLQ